MRFLFLLLLPGFVWSSEKLDGEVKRIVSNRVCVNCHTPGLPTSKAGALRVFDLSRADWFSTMSKKQFQQFQSRMLGQLSPEETREMGGMKADAPLSPLERTAVVRFVLERSN